FIIAGGIFYLTAATYAEGTAMYPEAGGSSSFARRAFNEFWSFFAAWGQMLNYVITIAISAFFVPHYLGGVLGVDALRHGPADLEGLPRGDPGGDDRLHRHRDDLEHGRGGPRRVQDDPRGDQARRHRRVRHLPAAARHRAQRPARHAERRRQVHDAPRASRGA